MVKKKERIKDSKLLQYFVDTGNDIDKFRDAVLRAVCEHHLIRNYESCINSEAVIQYLCKPSEQEDVLVVKLYAREEHASESSDNLWNCSRRASAIAVDDSLSTLRQPGYVVYTEAYVLVTPVSIIEKYIDKHYTITNNVYFRLHENL